eukprot:552123_1
MAELQVDVSLQELVEAHVETLFGDYVEEVKQNPGRVIDTFLRKHTHFTFEQHHNAILQILLDTYCDFQDVHQDENKEEEKQSQDVSDLAPQNEDNANNDGDDILESVENMQDYLDNKKYVYNNKQIKILDDLRKVLGDHFDIIDSPNNCACGNIQLNGYGTGGLCKQCLLRFWCDVLLCDKYRVINDQSILKLADINYLSYTEPEEMKAKISAKCQPIILAYLYNTIKLIGTSPLQWIFLQGDPGKAVWKPKKSLSYLNYFRSDVLYNYMSMNYESSKKWRKVSNCVEQLVSDGLIAMHHMTVYLPVLNRNEHYEWGLKRCALRRQKPHIKPTTGIAFIGDKGTGKDSYTDFLFNVFDDRNCIKFSTIEQVVSKFNADIADRMFIILNELNPGDAEKYLSTIKAYITDNKMHRENKFVARTQVPMTQEFMFLTNYMESVVPLMTNDSRRLGVYECSGDKVGNTQYFNELHECVAQEFIQQIFWQLLSKMDISNFNYRIIPTTDIMSRMRAQNVENNIGSWLLSLFHAEYEENNKEIYPYKYMDPRDDGETMYFMVQDGYQSYLGYVQMNKIGKCKSRSQFSDYMDNKMDWNRGRFRLSCFAYPDNKTKKVWRFTKTEIKQGLRQQRVPEQMFQQY